MATSHVRKFLQVPACRTDALGDRRHWRAGRLRRSGRTERQLVGLQQERHPRAWRQPVRGQPVQCPLWADGKTHRGLLESEPSGGEFHRFERPRVGEVRRRRPVRCHLGRWPGLCDGIDRQLQQQGESAGHCRGLSVRLQCSDRQQHLCGRCRLLQGRGRRLQCVPGRQLLRRWKRRSPGLPDRFKLSGRRQSRQRLQHRAGRLFQGFDRHAQRLHSGQLLRRRQRWSDPMPGGHLFRSRWRHRRQDLHPDHNRQFRGRRQHCATSLPGRLKFSRWRQSGERVHGQLQHRFCTGGRQLRSIGWFLQDRDR